MIQIEDWVIFAILLIFFFACAGYLLSFVRTRKLYPQTVTFSKQIAPKNAESLVSIAGKGIVKKVELQLAENDNTLVDIIIDQTNYSIVDFTTQANSPIEQKNVRTLSFEVNVDRKFFKSFSIFIENKSKATISSTGRVFYEIKNPQN